MSISDFRVTEALTVARPVSNGKDWFISRKSLKLLLGLKPEIALMFRKRFLKGFVKVGICNYYIGLVSDNVLIGVLGFYRPDYGPYDLLLKADTTPSYMLGSTELLLYVLQSKEVKQALDKKFFRDVTSVYSLCFSKHQIISRYRKHAELINKTEVGEGFNLGYLFQMGKYTFKEACSLWEQKRKVS